MRKVNFACLLPVCLLEVLIKTHTHTEKNNKMFVFRRVEILSVHYEHTALNVHSR